MLYILTKRQLTLFSLRFFAYLIIYSELCSQIIELLKTMKKIYLLVTLLVMMLAQSVMAEDFFDFKVDGIAYKINDYDSTTVSVSKEQNPNVPETNYTSYANLTGTLVLPEKVTYDGVTYTVTAIGLEAFQGCAGLTGELVLPKTIWLIDHWAFYQCTGLTGHVVIPDGVQTIGYGAFGECDGLEAVTIPASVRQLDPGSFDCRGLQTFTSLIDDILPVAASLNKRIFRYTTTGVNMNSCRLVVPAAALSQYQVFEPWKNFANIDVLENVDGQGSVDVSDVNQIINAMLGKTSDPQVMARADVNRDGTADVSDVNQVINIMLGKYESFSIPNVTVDMSGSYNTDMELSIFNNATFASRAESYGYTAQCTGITLEKIVDGVFYCNDLFGGYFGQIMGYNQYGNYVMTGYLTVDNDGNVSLMSSYCPGWNDSLNEFSGGHFDAQSGTLSYDIMYGALPFHVVLNRQ